MIFINVKTTWIL